MLTRLFGPSGSGKTTEIYRRISEDIKRGKRVWLVVPEQQTVDCERALVSLFGNTSNLRLEVLNFRRMPNRVARVTGGLAMTQLDGMTRVLLLSRVLEELNAELTEYSSVWDNPQLVGRLLETVDELKSHGMLPSDLEDAAADFPGTSLEAKLRDISIIYSGLSAACGADLPDAHDALSFLARLLAEHSFFSGDSVYFDGFNGLTPLQLAVVRQIMRQAEDCTFSLCTLPDGGEETARKVDRLSAWLEESAGRDFIPVSDAVLENPARFASPALAYYSKNIWSGQDIYPGQDDGAVTLYRCANIFEEAQAAATAVSRLVREEGWRYRDIAVMTRGLERYEGVLDAAFASHGIPLFMSRRADMASMPLMTQVLSAFDVVLRGWRRGDVMRYIKTGLLSSVLTQRECDLLDIYCAAWDINGVMWYGERDWDMHPSGYVPYDGEDAQVISTLEELNRARRKVVSPLGVFEQDIRNTDCKGIASAVYRLLTDTEVYSALSSHADRLREGGDEHTAGLTDRLWEILMDVLDKTVTVFGHRQVFPARYSQLLRLAVQTADIGAIPTAMDEVTAGDAALMRPDGVRGAILLGVNDGVFPASVGEGGIFSRRERQLLEESGLELSDSGEGAQLDELFTYYMAASAPSEKLYIIYSAADVGGGALSPSVAVERALSLFPYLEVKDYSSLPELERIHSKASGYAALGSCRDASLREALREALSRDAAYSGRLELIGASLGGGERIEDSGSRFFSGPLRLTASRIESFGQCRFSFYCKHMAGLRGAKGARLQPSDVGTFVHSVLERFVKRVYEDGGSLGEITDEYIAALVDELSEAYLREVIRSYEYKSGRFKYLLGRLRSTLILLAKNLRDEFRDCDFVPSGFEVYIGEGGDVRPLTISSPEGDLTVYGYVDRVDTYEHSGRTYLRVVDYKTGKKVFRISDVLAGLNLQMLIYLFAICAGGEERFGENPTPAGILYMPAGRPEYASRADWTPGEAWEQAEKTLKRNGLLLDDKDILEAMEKGLAGSVIPASVKKDGTLSQRSSVASASRLGRLERYIKKLLSQLSGELRRGAAQANPYRDGAHNACRYCDLRPVCRVEYGSPELRDFPSVTQDDAWDIIEKNSGGEGDTDG